MIASIPEDLKGELFTKISTMDLQHVGDRRIIPVLAAVADADLVVRVFSVLCSLRAESSAGADEEKLRRWAVTRQLRDLIRALPPHLAVAGMLTALSATPTALEYEILTGLFNDIHSEHPALKEHLGEDLRQRLRRYLKDGLAQALGQDDFGGGLKANVAMALARVGTPEDMPDLETLIRADLERVQRGMAARIRGDRSEAANGAVMRWSNWYAPAVVELDPARAGDVLLGLLAQAEYEADAASALVGLARARTAERGFGREVLDYPAVWTLRAGERPTGFVEDRRRRYTEALKERIAVIMEDRSQSDNPDSFNHRLKSLASEVALLDGRQSAEFVLEILALPGQWDGWTRANAIEALLRSGARLGAEATLRVLNPTIENSRARAFYDQQDASLLERCLSLLPFVDPCAVGVARVREVLANTRIAPYQLRETVRALGHSRCREAIDLLQEVPSATRGGFRSFAVEWIDAIVALNTTEGKQIALSFVDPDTPQTGLEPQLENHHRDRLASGIVDIAQSDPEVKERLYSLCVRQLASGKRLLLGEVVARLGTREALIAGLNLIHDQLAPPVPYELLTGLENVFLERRPYKGSAQAFTLEPRAANEIRSRLSTMVVNDTERRRSAWALIGQTESWRVEYGRPGGEPRHPELESGMPWPPIEAASAMNHC